MLKRSGNSGCLYLVPHLIGKTFKLPSSLTSFDVSDGLIDGLYNDICSNLLTTYPIFFFFVFFLLLS